MVQEIKFSECVEYMIKGPFGSDMKKSLYVPKGGNTYKVYIQGNAIQQDETLGDYYISEEYFHDKLERFEVHPGDYIITCDGTLGKYIRLGESIERGVISSSLLLLKLNEQVIYDKYFELLWEYSMLGYLSSQARNACLIHLPSAKTIGDVSIGLPDLRTQKEIANKLFKIKNVCCCREKELLLFDDIIKARFVEMFGELGTDTKGWGLQPISTCCELNPKKASDYRLKEGLDVSFIPMPAVSENGAIDVSEIRKYDEVKSGFTYFADNDVLFAKITPCMENGKGAVAVGLRNGVGFGSTEFHVLRPIAGKSNPYWLYTLTAFETFRKSAEMNMTGSAGQRRVPAGFFEKYMATVPPIELQKRFEEYVKQIDKSRVAVQKALDETKLLFDSLMQQYFG